MATYLHLLKRDSAVLAGSAIAGWPREPGDRVTVVLLDGAEPAPLPPGITPRRLGTDLDHDQLLDLIFAHDHVIAW